ncbi:MAG TPA: hypothetical protein VN808_14630 [Stellaceae bacterium]|nr:hypothetical protein [Stellaceae bacterium]
MQVSIDTELVTAAVEVIVVPLYLLLWHRYIRHAYAALAIAALILALCALLRSDTVRAWDPPALHHHVTPTNDPEPSGDIGLLASASFSWVAGSSPAMTI